MTQFKVTSQGEDTVKKQLNIIAKKVIGSFTKALAMQGFKTLKLALPKTPMDTGDLRNSSRVLLDRKEIAKGQDDGSLKIVSNVYLQSNKLVQEVVITVFFNTEYALKVHEWKNPEPNWTTPGTGPDYLINAFRDVVGDLQKDVFDIVKKTLNGTR